jgi:type II secretory pathway component GspD/PulD (secretin)
MALKGIEKISENIWGVRERRVIKELSRLRVILMSMISTMLIIMVSNNNTNSSNNTSNIININNDGVNINNVKCYNLHDYSYLYFTF